MTAPARPVFSGRALVSSSSSSPPAPLLTTTVPLSFWGGIDPLTGIVVDNTHPLFGESVAGRILVLPSGRGSCTASQVLLELILNHKAPSAIILRDTDGLVCVGALVAQQVFEATNVPTIIALGTAQFQGLISASSQNNNNNYGAITSNGSVVVGETPESLAANAAAAAAAAASLVDVDDASATTEQHPYYSKEELAMLDAAAAVSPQLTMATKVLIEYAHIVSPTTPAYVDISSAHIDGCTYIGPGGLQFAQRLAAGGTQKVKIPTTLNSGSCDRTRWKQLGVPKDYAINAIALGDAYLALGCQPSFTCAPYLLHKPQGDVCWGESNAVVYCNSVLGARTEKYADYLDICCALVGKTVATGVHLAEERKPAIVLDATNVLKTIRDDGDDDDALFPVLGHLCGTFSDGMVPILMGLEVWDVSPDNLKAFCAAFGTTGTSPLIHIAGVTPEAMSFAQDSIESKPVRTITLEDLKTTYRTLDSAANSGDNGHTTTTPVDLVAFGNPHLSVNEAIELSKLVANKKKHDDVRVMACMARELQDSPGKKATEKLKAFGVEFINDTCWCMLLDPPVIPISKTGIVLTNSGKYAHYGPGLTQRQYRFASTRDCIQAAVTGRRAAGLPQWLLGRRTYSSQRRSYFSTMSSSQLSKHPSYQQQSFSVATSMLKLVRRSRPRIFR